MVSKYYNVYMDNNFKAEYKFDNEFHNETGPAREWFDGSKEYWVRGKRHRLDGPAIIHYFPDERKNKIEYWIENVKYTEEEYYKDARVCQYLLLKELDDGI